MQDKGERYQTKVELYQEQSESTTAEYLLKIDCQGSGVFKINKTGIVVHWQKNGTSSSHYFQTLGLALWLELNQVLCIHGNALSFKDKAIALVAPSRTGKTTLSAALCQNGFALMTDDMVALQENNQQYMIYPSWPVARMWPDTINSLAIDKSENSSTEKIDRYKNVHNKFDKKIIELGGKNELSFDKKPRPLKTIYFLNRKEEKSNNKIKNDCEIIPLSSSKAVILLLQNSILGGAYKHLGMENKRVQAISKLISNISFKQINYSSGKACLNNVCGTIISDQEIEIERRLK